MGYARQVVAAVVDWAGRTPLTDPRSVGSSVAFHALLLVVASAAALTVVAPGPSEGPRALHAELEPVDNRADQNQTPGEGGGGPGELGGGRLASALESLAPATGGAADRPAPSDALLAEILPAPVNPEAVRQALPGPQTSGLGLLPGPGGGSGGGSGGGVGGGVGRGVGPGTEFFGAREHANSFAYVIDCSGSMAARNALEVAKRELVSSLSRLSPDARFTIIFYNLHATIFSDPAGQRGLMPATVANKARVETQLAQISPDGGTDHMQALRAALAMRPEVVFFLTDADLMTRADAQGVLAAAGQTRIQAVEFGRGADLAGDDKPLRLLANGTGGTYRYIDVTGFPRRP